MSKEQYVIDYIAEWDNPDLETPETLYRYIRNNEGYWCESLMDDGQWDESNVGISLITETHNPYYARITKEEAEKIAEQLNGSIYDD